MGVGQIWNTAKYTVSHFWVRLLKIVMQLNKRSGIFVKMLSTIY